MFEFLSLQHFVAVARERSFTKAAEQVHVSRPALTRSIKRLEEQVGAQLLERTTRSVTLTSAGEGFFAEAVSALDRLALAAGRARRIGAGDHAALRIGVCETAEPETQSVVEGYHAFHKLWPKVEVTFRAVARRDQGAALRGGEVDLGVMLLNRDDCDGLEWRTLYRGNLKVLVPRSWGLAGDRVRLEQLHDRPWLIADPRRLPDVHQLQMALCRSAGFEPKIVGRPDDPVTGRMLVACEMGAIFINGLREFHTPPTTRLMALEGLSESFASETVVAWASGNETAELRGLVDCMAQAARF